MAASPPGRVPCATSARKAARSASDTAGPLPLPTMVSTSPVVPASSPVGGRLDRLRATPGFATGGRSAVVERTRAEVPPQCNLGAGPSAVFQPVQPDPQVV